MVDDSRNVDHLNHSLKELNQFLTHLIQAMIGVRDGFKAEIETRKRSYKLYWLSFVVLTILLVANLANGIYDHISTQPSRTASQVAAECLKPVRPSPPGTPFNQLTCYERNQVIEHQLLDAQASYINQVVQAIIQHKPLPEPHVTIPGNP